MTYIRHGLIVILFILLVLTPDGKTSGQALATWAPPEWIPGFIDSSLPPAVIADPNGKVHVFNSQWIGENFTIVYSQWTVGVGWTKPVDIFLAERQQVRICDAFLDNSGMINLVYWGGINNINANIYFTQAPATSAGKSSAWSSPQLIGKNAIAPTTSMLSGDGEGYLVVVYSGNEEGNGLYSVTSHDGGATWAPSKALFLTLSETLWPSVLQLGRSSDSQVHAVWALGDLTGNSRSVHYSRLEPITGDWTTPIILAKSSDAVVDRPSIIEHDGNLMVIYEDGIPLTRWMIRSGDNGQTWSSPTRLFRQVGGNGAAALVIDSGNTLHMFFGNRIDATATHGLWHSIWVNGSWSEPEPIISGPQITIGERDGEGFDPSYAQAVIIRGNIIMPIWRHDPMVGPIHIWYTYRQLDTAELPVKQPPGFSTDQTPIAELLTTPSATPPAFVTSFPDTSPQSGKLNLNLMLMGSIAPAVLLLIVIIVFTRTKR